MKNLLIIHSICGYHFSEKWDKPGKAGDVVFERAIYYRIARNLTPCSFASIGKMVKKDHATVIHGLKIFENDIAGGAMPKNKRFYGLYEGLMLKCRRKINHEKQKSEDEKAILVLENINLRAENKKLKETIKTLVA